MASTDYFKSSLGHSLNYTLFLSEGRTNDVPSIVFIHGLGSSQNFYYSIAKEISTKHGYNCLIFDNYGASLSNINSNEKLDDASIENSQGDIVELIQHLKLNNITLVGHSMGGMIASYVASNAKGVGIEVNKLVLLAPVHPNSNLKVIFDKRVDTLLKEKKMSTLANTIPELAVGSGANGLIKGFIRELVARQSTEGYIYNCNLISNTSSNLQTTKLFNSEIYQNIKVPVLFILGVEDKTSPWENCVQIIYELLGSNDKTINSIPKVGHWIAVEAYNETLEAIKKFLEI